MFETKSGPEVVASGIASPNLTKGWFGLFTAYGIYTTPRRIIVTRAPGRVQFYHNTPWIVLACILPVAFLPREAGAILVLIAFAFSVIAWCAKDHVSYYTELSVLKLEEKKTFEIGREAISILELRKRSIFGSFITIKSSMGDCIKLKCFGKTFDAAKNLLEGYTPIHGSISNVVKSSPEQGNNPANIKPSEGGSKLYSQFPNIRSNSDKEVPDGKSFLP